MLVVLADGCGESLCFDQRLIDCLSTGDHLRELLRNLVAQLLELVDVDVLDTNVRHLVDGRVGDIGVRDRVKGDLGETAGGCLVLGQGLG